MLLEEAVVRVRRRKARRVMIMMVLLRLEVFCSRRVC